MRSMLNKSDLLEDVRANYCFRGSDAYFHFRAFVPGGAETARLHCIQMQQIDETDGNKNFKSIFSKNDPLEWFDE